MHDAFGSESSVVFIYLLEAPENLPTTFCLAVAVTLFPAQDPWLSFSFSDAEAKP